MRKEQLKEMVCAAIDKRAAEIIAVGEQIFE